MDTVAHSPLKNIMTFDLEEWFHILDLPNAPNYISEKDTIYRAERGLERFLELVDRYRVSCTFFVLGWLAERTPGLLKKIDTSFHEIGSHGYGHELITSLKPSVFRNDIHRAKKSLEDLIGKEIIGYRGPGFSITKNNLWAFDIIAEAGYVYDATLYPGEHGHGGIPGLPVRPFSMVTLNGLRLEEYPMSLLEIGPMRLTFSGGGYFRLLPAFFITSCIRILNGRNIPACSYFHPRDLDPDVPKIPMPAIRRFKCYVNISKTYAKLGNIMKAHTFCSIRDWRYENHPLLEFALASQYAKYSRSE
jgi:polysaccharide deacetylase family protein (PEP-CTERM system associated)